MSPVNDELIGKGVHEQSTNRNRVLVFDDLKQVDRIDLFIFLAPDGIFSLSG